MGSRNLKIRAGFVGPGGLRCPTEPCPQMDTALGLMIHSCLPSWNSSWFHLWACVLYVEGIAWQACEQRRCMPRVCPEFLAPHWHRACSIPDVRELRIPECGSSLQCVGVQQGLEGAGGKPVTSTTNRWGDGKWQPPRGRWNWTCFQCRKTAMAF